MKKLISFLLLAFLFACNSGDTPTSKEPPSEDQQVMAKTLPSGNFVWIDTVGGWQITITAKDSTVNATGTYSYSYKTKKVDTTWRQLGSNSNACTGYIYSAWSTCTNGKQTRTVTGFSPNGCKGNPPSQPVLSQSCGVIPDPNNEGYTLIYTNGFDTWNPQTQKGDLDPFDHGQIGKGSLSTTIFKTGPGSFKSVPANVSSGIRSEVQFEDGQTPTEGIVEYDVYYDNFFSNSGHSFQWHPSTDGGSGTGLFHKEGKMQFVTVKSGTSGTNVGSPFAVSTKAWHHFKLTYKFGKSGYIKVEMDGVEKVNANVQMGDGSRPFMKIGVNMWVNQTSVVYYDNLSVYKKN